MSAPSRARNCERLTAFAIAAVFVVGARVWTMLPALVTASLLPALLVYAAPACRSARRQV